MKALMYLIITSGIFIVVLLGVLALSAPVLASGGHHECHHHDDCGEPEPQPVPDPGPVVVHKKKVVVNVPALLFGIGGGICIYKRFWTDDPCIGKPAYKTSAADDRVTPTPPTPEFGLNVEVTK